MPIGSHHTETGWLNDRDGERILRRDEGGSWRLEMGFVTHWRTRKLIGKRIRVLGIRSGFDVLDVVQIEPN